MRASHKDATRQRWLETLERYKRYPYTPGSDAYWAPSLDTASGDELIAIQNAKLAALLPFLYANSPFYRRRFERLGMLPADIKTVEDLPKWPVVDKAEMVEDALAHPPYGTYTTIDEAMWAKRGWMMFASSGTTGAPRVFRYSQIDRDYWAWANARGLEAMGIGKGDTVFMISGYGPHVWAWGVQMAFAKMEVPVIPGGGMDARARAQIIQRFQPTVICCTPSYALYLGRVLQDMGIDPGETPVQTLFIAGEPAMGITHTRQRLENLWKARIVEFYGCTETSPHVGGYSCAASVGKDGTVTTHLMEDVQVWELVDAESREPVKHGERGLTVCTCLNSESSPQLRFLVGDYTVFDDCVCACGRTHVRAVGAFTGRADDLINLRGIKMYPSQIEAGVRAVPGIGDEYEIVLSTDPSGLDILSIRVEHPDHEVPDAIATRAAEEVRTRCEVRVGVEVLPPGMLPKTEFKAKRVRDARHQGR
jgi:phenylacetate-CoA ligase